MTKFLIGVVTGIVLTLLTGVILVFSLVRLGGEKRPTVSGGSTLVLRLEGEIPERAPVEIPLPFLEQQTPLTMLDTWDILRKAAVDSRIKAVILEPRGLAVGWGKMQELRASLEQFRRSGKPLVAYLRSPGTREYYLASAADKVYLSPEDLLDVKGLRAELMFFRRTLDKLGVQVEIEHAGKYKDFGDTFVRDKMSPETREVINSVLDEIYGHLVDTLAKARKKTPEQMRAIIDDGPFLADQALAKGLVDALVYEDQMLDDLKKRAKLGEIKKVSHRDYAKVPASSLGLEGGSRIAVLMADGGITRGSSSGDGSSDDGIGSIGFNRMLRRIADDGSIRGVVVRIDSPGGDAIASDDIWREMNLLARRKPLVISMSDVAASGGYYMAMTGDPIVAYPGTYTGSIGVVYGKANLKGLYDKLGITKDILTRGRFADVDSDYSPLTEPARRKLREGIDNTYKTFVAKVAEARKRKYEDVEPLAQGRVWLGSQAKQRGLIDELGGLDRAIELVKKKARIGATEKVTLVAYPPKRSVFDLLWGHTPESVLDGKLKGLLKTWQLRLWAQGGLMRLMPYTVDVR
ncbi:MAG: signal peptide peptidase SppA [Candidatus Solibacter usitatus]|nr:signal peptide peptidase SppA [Candidatus Solibacter usitatus]